MLVAVRKPFLDIVGSSITKLSTVKMEIEERLLEDCGDYYIDGGDDDSEIVCSWIGVDSRYEIKDRIMELVKEVPEYRFYPFDICIGEPMPSCAKCNLFGSCEYIHGSRDKLQAEYTAYFKKGNKKMQTTTLTEKLKAALQANLHLLVPFMYGYLEANNIEIPHLPALGKAGSYAAALKIIEEFLDDGAMKTMIGKAVDDMLVIAAMETGRRIGDDDIVEAVIQKLSAGASKMLPKSNEE